MEDEKRGSVLNIYLNFHQPSSSRGFPHFSSFMLAPPSSLTSRILLSYSPVRTLSTIPQTSQHSEECDVVVVGGGPVGLALAGALSMSSGKFIFFSR